MCQILQILYFKFWSGDCFDKRKKSPFIVGMPGMKLCRLPTLCGKWRFIFAEQSLDLVTPSGWLSVTLSFTGFFYILYKPGWIQAKDKRCIRPWMEAFSLQLIKKAAKVLYFMVMLKMVVVHVTVCSCFLAVFLMFPHFQISVMN